MYIDKAIFNRQNSLNLCIKKNRIVKNPWIRPYSSSKNIKILSADLRENPCFRSVVVSVFADHFKTAGMLN